VSVAKPNIVWITLDSIRADHTSVNGYSRETTPELFRISEMTDGTNFTHAIAQSTRTPVSVPSMLTGLYPSHHQMVGENSGNKIPESMATAPELFADCGYHTIGLAENGYAGKIKGFDHRYDDFVSINADARGLISKYPRTIAKYIFNVRSHGPGFSLYKSKHGEQTSFFTSDIAKRKISQAPDSDPVFCYIHYNDSHHPYIPPIAYQNKYRNEIGRPAREAIKFAKRMNKELYQWMADGLPLSSDEWEMLHAMYDATINYMDAIVGEMFDFVQTELDDTIFVVTSDHGDLFGESGLLGHHIALHDGVINVPMVVHGLNGVSDHAHKPTQHIDLMQTLLSVVGADTSQFQGCDLRNESREVAISQDLRGTVDDPDAENYERIRQYNSEIDLSHLPKSLTTAVRTDKYKLVHTDEWDRLYKLPNESEDVKNKYPSVFDKLIDAYNDWKEETDTKNNWESKEVKLDEKMEDHLRDMGYLE
jgi:uncharacterized sulfatase